MCWKFMAASLALVIEGAATYVARIDTDGDAGLLLHFLRHLDGVR